MQPEPVTAGDDKAELSGEAISPPLTLTATQMPGLDITDYLEHHRQIAAIWGIEDVQEQRPDLNGEQAWEVLQQTYKHYDCDYGITWATLNMTASDLFPEPEPVAECEEEEQ